MQQATGSRTRRWDSKDIFRSTMMRAEPRRWPTRSLCAARRFLRASWRTGRADLHTLPLCASSDGPIGVSGVILEISNRGGHLLPRAIFNCLYKDDEGQYRIKIIRDSQVRLCERVSSGLGRAFKISDDALLDAVRSAGTVTH